MDTIEVQTVSRKRRQGQTLAEFAITLPTLLLIMFGIIEFGRIFQAWVTLQNSARTAARYASTGQYFEDQFTLNPITETNKSDPTGFIPCVDDGPAAEDRTYPSPTNHTADQRGTKTTVQPNGVGNGTVNVYSGGLESLFATWYDGKNCDPRVSDDLDKRKDMARILSIMLEARRGAGGLGIEDSQWNLPVAAADRNNVQANWNQLPWFQGWQTIPRPPRSDQRNWFNVVVCSDRGFFYPFEEVDTTQNVSTAKYTIDGVLDTIGVRFIPYIGDQTLRVNGSVVTPWTPACLLNENPDATKLPSGGFSNAGLPWMDPGGPEDTVYVTVTFNHPLITPLGIAPFIPLQARRSAIIETFRASGNRTAAIFGPPIGANAPQPTNTPTNTATATVTRTPTITRTPTATRTLTKTPPGPFTCAALSLSNKRLGGPQGSQVQIDIQNNNAQTTFLTRVQITWPNIPSVAQMGLTQMTLNGVQVWAGSDPQTALPATTTTTDTNTKPGTPPFSSIPTSDRELANQDTGIFAATFRVPTLLSNYVSANQFAITITVDNPLDPAAPCVLTSAATTSTATPGPTPTRTLTPDCSAGLITVRFNSFDNFGIVSYDILSQRTTTSTLVSLNLNWVKYVTSQRLVGVSLGAPPGQSGSVAVWDSGNVNQDATPPTNSSTEGTWLSNYTIPAGAPGSPSITSIYFDFEGIYRYDDYYAMTSPRYGGSSDFNFSQFGFTCGTTILTATPIVPVVYPSPTTVPTLTLTPTRTPTRTPTVTRTPGPTNTPTLTRTPGPTATITPTRTPGPTNTPRPTNTIGPTPTPAPPTRTPTPVTPTATLTRTATRTATPPTPPTATRTATATPLPTATRPPVTNTPLPPPPTDSSGN